MESGNPVLRARVFEQERALGGEAMTVSGAVNKCFLLLVLLVMSASWVWSRMVQPTSAFGQELGVGQTVASMLPYAFGGGIAAFILGLVTAFKRDWAKVTAPLYALCNGLFIGGISAIFEMRYPGIVIQAVSLTFGTLFCMLAIYKSGVIKVNDKFIFGVASATGAIFLVYVVNWIMSFFGLQMGFIQGSGMFGIIFSVVVVGVAALNLVLDFHLIEEGAQYGLNKHMEWYCAWALIVTLVWLYIEMLKLLAKLRDRR